MVDLEVELATLELQWCKADDLLKAARAELAVGAHASAAVIAALRMRVERAERMKVSIMKKIIALEESMDSASLG